MLRLILLGFFVVAVPLVVAIITAIAQVDRLARDSRSALVDVQQNTVLSRTLADRVTEMERSARQYQALSDSSYKELYDEHRREALGLFDQLSAGSSNAELQMSIREAKKADGVANRHVEEIVDGGSAHEMEAALDDLRNKVLEVVRQQNSIARSMANAMPEQARRLQRTLFGQATLVIPLSVIFAILFVTLITRPLRQIDQGIRSLGRGALGEPVSVRGTRDLAELGQRLDWLRVRLVELEAQKSQFLRNVSHELKTPLTNIREGAELLLDANKQDADPKDRRVVQILHGNSVRLQRMIEELLHYGADGDLATEGMNETVQFDQLVHEAIHRYALTIAARRLTVSTSMAKVQVIGNSKQLFVIIDNLLSNALKYTPSGGRIDIELASNDDLITLDIRDNGPGIARTDRPHIFEWFYTGPRPPESIVAGTGMGLAIAQEYAQQHDGQIRQLESEKGAHFVLVIARRKHDGT